MTQPGLASELVQCTFVNGRTVFHSILSYNSHMSIPYYHVDAFTEELFAGNPAGVCILSVFPPDATMQKIAAENKHSETAFVAPRADGDFDLRWFTPEVEDDLCGHATLASAYVLTLLKHTAWPVRFHTRSGVLTVTREQDGFELDFPPRPPQPCATPVALFPAVGIAEDPATGSIHCTLAPYWAGRLGKRTLRAQQLSARGGSMQCKIAGDRVKIVGQARLYLQGTIAL